MYLVNTTSSWPISSTGMRLEVHLGSIEKKWRVNPFLNSINFHHFKSFPYGIEGVFSKTDHKFWFYNLSLG